MTDTGISVVEGLADRWLAYQAIAKSADVESRNSDRNVSDRVDAASSTAAKANGIPWQWVGAGLAAVVGLVFVFKLIK